MVVWRGWAGWEVVVAVAAVLVAGAAVWVTLEADFLAHPGWLAVQKADFILGPVFVGLYWRRMRPESRFGPLLIGFGAVGAVYILQSATNPWLFGIAVFWEGVIYLGNQALILTFPTGRLDGRAVKLVLVAAVVAFVLNTVVSLLVSQLGPDGSISGCRALCPNNALAITSQPSLALDLVKLVRVVVVVIDLAAGGLLVWRMVIGTPPQRRALAIGTPVALAFLLLHISYQVFKLAAPDAEALHEVIQWGVAVARSLIWYGFLFALIAAQLFAGRVLHSLVRQSLRRPSQHEVEAMMREPLGDPGLRLAFWDPTKQTWTDADAEGITLPTPEPGRELAIVGRGDGTPAVAVDHDAQLDADPELLRAAGAVALLAAENAELDAASNDAQAELRRSRARIVLAGESERKKLERNLHDGVQQRLVSVRIRLALAGEHAGEQVTIRHELDGIGESVEEAIEELREVAHGLYPPVLSERGLLAALAHIHTTAPLDLRATDIGQHPAELESAVYYCCLEAIQNATKHGGPTVQISVTLREDADELSFEVTDDGPGFDASDAHAGTGLQNMRDRVGALDGHISIVTAPGHGTTVSGAIPLHRGRLTTPVQADCWCPCISVAAHRRRRAT